MLSLGPTPAHAQSHDPKAPAPLRAGVNKGNLDNKSGADYYYFYAGPGHIAINMAFKETPPLASPIMEPLNFDLYDEQGKLISHNVIEALDKLERLAGSGEFGNRHIVVMRIALRDSPSRLSGYYEVEVTGAVSFEVRQN
jgi:hypothetical protein